MVCRSLTHIHSSKNTIWKWFQLWSESMCFVFYGSMSQKRWISQRWRFQFSSWKFVMYYLKLEMLSILRNDIWQSIKTDRQTCMHSYTHTKRKLIKLWPIKILGNFYLQRQEGQGRKFESLPSKDRKQGTLSAWTQTLQVFLFLKKGGREVVLGELIVKILAVQAGSPEFRFQEYT